MRIDPVRVPQPAEIRRSGDKTTPLQRPPRDSISETSDLLSVSAGLRMSQSREALLNELQETYRSGALRPDPGRIAERMIRWGFDVAQEHS